MNISLNAFTGKFSTELIGYIDPFGNFQLPLKDLYVNSVSDENLGFFKKISYNDKQKELNDAHHQSFSKLIP
jgi:hypothetical protein